MTRGVSLPALPAGLRFPREFQNRICYDAREKRLEFDGFMSKTDFDRLLRLHNDVGYQRALEELFQKCTFAEATQSHRSKLPLIVAGLAAAAFATLVIFGGGLSF